MLSPQPWPTVCKPPEQRASYLPSPAPVPPNPAGLPRWTGHTPRSSRCCWPAQTPPAAKQIAPRKSLASTGCRCAPCKEAAPARLRSRWRGRRCRLPRHAGVGDARPRRRWPCGLLGVLSPQRPARAHLPLARLQSYLAARHIPLAARATSSRRYTMGMSCYRFDRRTIFPKQLRAHGRQRRAPGPDIRHSPFPTAPAAPDNRNPSPRRHPRPFRRRPRSPASSVPSVPGYQDPLLSPVNAGPGAATPPVKVPPPASVSSLPSFGPYDLQPLNDGESKLSSTYIPVDSPVYPMALRLYSLGYLDTAFIDHASLDAAQPAAHVE